MKRRTSRPAFGTAGTKLIEYLGKMPAAFGPFITMKTYRFRPGKNPRLVDVRDLTLLVKAVGRGNLRDVNEPEPKPKAKLKSKKTEEVDDDTERDTDG